MKSANIRTPGDNMKIRIIATLFFCSVVPWSVGNGLLPLLPVYAANLGAEEGSIGLYMGFSYLCVAVGTLLGGWFSDRFQRRKALLILAGFGVAVSILLIGFTSQFWQLVILTASTWFFGGVGMALIYILAGLFADSSHRGKVFGILSVSCALGMVLGGSTTGLIADRWGFAVMFRWVAGFGLMWPLLALAFLEDKRVERPAAESTSQTPEVRIPVRRIATGICFLFLANMLAGIAMYIGRLGTSLQMQNKGFTNWDISMTACLSGLAVLPLPFLIGWLSDRLGRKRLLSLCYITGAVGLVFLVPKTAPDVRILWTFWTAAALMTVLSSGTDVGAAWVADLAPKEALGLNMSIFNSSRWVGAIVGMVAAGLAIKHLGYSITYGIGVVLTGMSLLVLFPIGRQEADPSANAADKQEDNTAGKPYPENQT
jgi:predicted MFS family arabinose efflux permease